MKTKLTKDELQEILKLHEAWLRGENDGMRAYLQDTDLRRADLRSANLQGAYLQNADLQDADLRGANLQGANLQDANLQGADLWNANLQGADLQGADLQDTDLQDTIGVKLVCPSHGAFTGWKKARYMVAPEEESTALVKLKISEDAMRSSATSRKCRCSRAKVESIYEYEFQNDNLIIEPINVIAHSSYDCEFLYKVGELVAVDNFEEDRWIECAPGIHFFITPEEAALY